MMNLKPRKILLILLGIILLSIFIWIKFFRERMPKEIPFTLSLLGFMILINICIMYLLAIKTLIKKSKTNIPLLTTFFNIIYTPLITIDESIKTHPVILPYYEKILLYLITKGKKVNYFYTYFFFQIFPRIILVTVLLIDIFLYHKIFLLYKFIPISILIFLGKYILYSFKYAKELYIKQLEAIVDLIITDFNDIEEDPEDLFITTLTIRRFIEEQVNSIVYNEHTYTFKPLAYKFSKEEHRLMETKFYMYRRI